MRKTPLFILFLSLVLGAWTFEACNNPENNDSVEDAKEANDSSNLVAVEEEDAKFAVKAANGGMAEVEMGNLGSQKATHVSVKEFSSLMVADHTKANDELKMLASSKNITLPAGVGEDHQEHLAKLAQKTGEDFDKAYMDMMVDDHQKTVELFEKQSTDGKDAELKAFATNTLPVLRTHLDSAKAIRERVKD